MNQRLLHIILSFGLFLMPVLLRAQKSDIELIESETFNKPEFHYNREVTFGISNSDNFIIKYNPVSLTFSAFLFVYQKTISRQISADCLFIPSCSSYSKELFLEYGLVKGLFCTADRLMRCNRIAATTINPIRVDPHDHHVHETTDYYNLKKK